MPLDVVVAVAVGIEHVLVVISPEQSGVGGSGHDYLDLPREKSYVDQSGGRNKRDMTNFKYFEKFSQKKIYIVHAVY